jgi:hypothetical protein
MNIHPPTKICSGRIGDIHDDEVQKRVLIADPETGRGSVHSTKKTAKGRPEFVFLDTLGTTDAMISSSGIITDYENANELPNDMEVVSKDPFGIGTSLTFVARLIPEGHPFKRALQTLYLHGHAEHGFVVMIPYITEGKVANWWGSGHGGRVTELTSKALDKWINAILNEEYRSVQRLHDMLGGHLH